MQLATYKQTNGERKLVKPRFVAAIYIRVSTKEQAREEKVSLPIQEEDLVVHAQKYGWRVRDIYKDVLTGSLSFENRKGGSRLLDDATEGKFNLVAVWDYDRLGRDRDGLAAHIFRSKMRQHGIQVYSLHQPHQLKDPEEFKEDPYDDGQILLENIHDWQSASTINKFRLRSMKGKEARVRKGKMINTPPYGYKLEPKGDKKGNTIVNNGRVVYKRAINELEAKIVRRIYHEYVYEGKSMNEIRDHLNTEAVLTRVGGVWERASVARILKNPVYYGVLIYNKYHRRKNPLTGKTRWGKNPKEKWIIVPPEKTEHKAIVSEELFNKAQSVRRAKLRLGAVAVYSDFLFSGIPKCGKCGSKMYRKKVTSHYTRKSDGKTTKSQSNGYVCGRWQRFRDTEKNYISERNLKEGVLSDLKRFKNNPLTLKSFLEESKRKDLHYTEKLLKSKKKALSKVEERYIRLLRAYEFGRIPLDKFDAAVGRLDKEEEKMKFDIERLKREAENENKREMGKKDFLEAIEKFESIVGNNDIKVQKSFLRSLIESIVVGERKITINYWLGDKKEGDI